MIITNIENILNIALSKVAKLMIVTLSKQFL